MSAEADIFWDEVIHEIIKLVINSKTITNLKEFPVIHYIYNPVKNTQVKIPNRIVIDKKCKTQIIIHFNDMSRFARSTSTARDLIIDLSTYDFFDTDGIEIEHYSFKIKEI